ncbi:MULTISPECIES: hypothetical protein [Planktothrix]|jgi:DNA-binding Xre family transcriptional regulator|uniref:Uncharacterized protein n=1 Tax=Planktothrix rubescens CCAP 1459/22 TaxID=329571 RepID=A0A6J7ZKC0_PLARU|nr:MULTISPECIES: hypothetical protein [Planktothrix]CAC5342126.1 conserved hypothetical protein [Planktothrix rubescens NIVA-CYA 18]CAD5926012.1 hypothetical protein PCC7821_00970 [Planktothrix rubescens NIVA-CYA 18]
MDLHKIFDELIGWSGIRNKDLASKLGRSVVNISQIRNGKVNLAIKDFGNFVEVCDGMYPGFKKQLARQIYQSDFDKSSLSLSEIAQQIDSGRLSDYEVAMISSEVADIVVAISKRLKNSSKC